MIVPPISLDVLRRRLPALRWTVYPRSITTPEPEVARKLWQLIQERRKYRGAEIDEEETRVASLHELRALALAQSSSRASVFERRVSQRKRQAVIRRYALARANGRCEFCKEAAPFLGSDGAPYLESHHILRLADEEPDHPKNVIGICPNCHRRAHHAQDREKIRTRMKRRAAALWRET